MEGLKYLFKPRVFLWALLLPIFGTAVVLMHFLISEKDKPKWFMNIWSKKGNYFEKFIGVLVSPIAGLVILILTFGYEHWEGLPN